MKLHRDLVINQKSSHGIWRIRHPAKAHEYTCGDDPFRGPVDGRRGIFRLGLAAQNMIRSEKRIGSSRATSASYASKTIVADFKDIG